MELESPDGQLPELPGQIQWPLVVSTIVGDNSES